MIDRPRVAFFTDCFHEVNGVALTSRELDRFALSREAAFFSLHVGPRTTLETHGLHTTMELRRSFASIPLDAGMYFDVFGLRHLSQVRRALETFQPDLIHITGPGDCGLLGALLAWQLGVPLVASWHTNLHEFGARRLERVLGGLPPSGAVQSIGAAAEWLMLSLLKLFYGFGRVLLAPNPELMGMLEAATHRPTFLMQRGVDTTLYNPTRRTRRDDIFTIGHVGRLSPEKNVRVLAEIERGLEQLGFDRFRVLIVGQGSQREWLRQNMKRAEFTGVLKGEPLAEAYANMDVFAFPSETDTFGNVVLEALASGVPTVVTTNGGPKFLIQEGVTGFVAPDASTFTGAIAQLMRDRVRQLQMSRAARDYALGASWDSVFEKVYSAYGQALRPVEQRASIITTDASRTRR